MGKGGKLILINKKEFRNVIIDIFTPYLTKEKIRKRIFIVIGMHVLYMVLQAYLAFSTRTNVALAFVMVPLTISGWLLGTWAPFFIGLITIPYLMIIADLSKLEGGDRTSGLIINGCMILFGMLIGTLSNYYRQVKSTAIELQKAKTDAEVANKSKTEFLASISHEIRTPMNSIIGFATLLRDEENDNQKKEKLNIILNAGNILLNLINDLLDFSKLEAGKIELVNMEFTFEQLFTPIQNIFSLKAKEKHIAFNVNLDNNLPRVVTGDERRIQQILINLIGNAIKFTHKGKVEVNFSYANAKVIFTVSDTGIGIAKDKQKLIFSAFKQVDPSFSREYGGTGLGLSISKQLTKQMNGTIILKSEMDIGTTITVEIPLPDVSSKYRDKYPVTRQDDNSDVLKNLKEVTALIAELKKYNYSFKILVAEDNDLNREYIKHLLSALGVSVDYAINGKETLNILNNLKEEKNGLYDLLLLDIQMPVVSGLEILKTIRSDEKLKKLYIVALTAHAMKGDEEKYLEAGCDYYISKPVNRKILTNKIYELILNKYKIIPEAREQKNEKVNGKTDEKSNEKITGELGKQDTEVNGMGINTQIQAKIKKIVKILKLNYEIFNPQELKIQEKELENILPTSYYNNIREKINSSIANYDDEVLLEIIKKLEEII